MPITLAQMAAVLLLLVGLFVARIACFMLGQVHHRDFRERAELIQTWLYGNADDAKIVLRISPLSDVTLSALVSSYSHTVEGRRWEELAALLRGTPWFTAIKRRAKSPFWWRRLHSARALALLAGDGELCLARSLLSDRHQAVRQAAAGILKRLPDRDMLREVFDESLRATPALQAYLFDILQWHDRSVVDVVLERLSSCDDSKSLAVAVRYVREVADPIYMDAVLKLLHHPVSSVRAAAVRAVAVFPNKRTWTALAGVLDDRNPDVREAACESIGLMGAIEMAGALTPRMSDASWRVRFAACVALRRMGVSGVRMLRDATQQADGAPDARLVRYVLGLESYGLTAHAFSMGAV